MLMLSIGSIWTATRSRRAMIRPRLLCRGRV
jgi:hypothetical protein